MTDASRNTRTLIVSFVIAIMALIPMRFVEVGQTQLYEPQVLGEEVVLPEEGLVVNELEAPYNEIENQAAVMESKCINENDALTAISEFNKMMERDVLSVEEVAGIQDQIRIIDENTCR